MNPKKNRFKQNLENQRKKTFQLVLNAVQI